MGRYKQAEAVLEKYKHVPAIPPAGNTYFCMAPDLCPVCVAQREEERERRRKIMNALEHCPYDKYGQGYASARREYLDSIQPDWNCGPAPKNCVKSKMQRALYDEWNERDNALQEASIAMGRDKYYLSRLEIVNEQAAKNGGKQIAVGDPLPYWDDPAGPDYSHLKNGKRYDSTQFWQDSDGAWVGPMCGHTSWCKESTRKPEYFKPKNKPRYKVRYRGWR